MTRGVSTGPRAARSVFDESLVGEAIEGTGLRIGLELAIPSLAIKLSIPTTKLRQLLSRQGGDIVLEFLNLGHDSN